MTSNYSPKFEERLKISFANKSQRILTGPPIRQLLTKLCYLSSRNGKVLTVTRLVSRVLLEGQTIHSLVDTLSVILV